MHDPVGSIFVMSGTGRRSAPSISSPPTRNR